jgi:hypothetical protein
LQNRCSKHGLSHASGLFSSGYFGAGVSRTIWTGWPRTPRILSISAAQVARITDVSSLTIRHSETPGLFRQVAAKGHFEVPLLRKRLHTMKSPGVSYHPAIFNKCI